MPVADTSGFDADTVDDALRNVVALCDLRVEDGPGWPRRRPAELLGIPDRNGLHPGCRDAAIAIIEADL